MAKILVGIATVTPDKRFLESLPSFFQEAGRIHQLDCMWVWNKPLVDAQNDFAERMVTGDYDYLLTLEDDHWGFTASMLKSCIAADTHVCGISYRSRHLPFMKIPMVYSGTTGPNGNKLYDSIKHESGFHEADLIGFGFTLIKSEVFRILDRPYFRLNTDRFKGVGPRATDIDFSTRLIEKGIRPIGCFDYVLNHREITESNYKEMLVGGIIEKQNFFSMLRRNSQKLQKEKV
jgi:hypothetical protein